MRYDIGISSDRRVQMESVIDSLIGLEQETWIENGVRWHRDDEYHAGIMVEDDFRDFAQHMTINGAWYGFNLHAGLLNAIDYRNCVFESIGQREVYTEKEMQLMRDELLKRMIGRLSKYARNGQRVAVNDNGGDVVGFRWE